MKANCTDALMGSPQAEFRTQRGQKTVFKNLGSTLTQQEKERAFLQDGDASARCSYYRATRVRSSKMWSGESTRSPDFPYFIPGSVPVEVIEHAGPDWADARRKLQSTGKKERKKDEPSTATSGPTRTYTCLRARAASPTVFPTVQTTEGLRRLDSSARKVASSTFLRASWIADECKWQDEDDSEGQRSKAATGREQRGYRRVKGREGIEGKTVAKFEAVPSG
ncbi:hypothetical protein DFH06DRAFT_1387901 [Mycena polygramma]|nr:hypothetical protein DFH06DRAFT_1387901 [Mycena polygramma]